MLDLMIEPFEVLATQPGLPLPPTAGIAGGARQVTTSLPVPGTVVWSAVAITALGFALVFTRHWSVLRVLGACALAGIAWQVTASLS